MEVKVIALINIGDINLECLIEGTGEKTVVIVPGMGCSFYPWLSIANEISKYAKVVSFHRTGYGSSDAHIESSTTEIATVDLHALLEKLNIKENIILVGHSYGGLCVQHFARVYPKKICGVVLVDSSSVDGYKFNELHLPVSDKTEGDDIFIKEWTRYSKYTKEQLENELKPSLSAKELQLPSEVQNRILDFLVNPELYRNTLSELIDLRIGVRKIKDTGSFPQVPLKILVRDTEYNINESIKADGIPRVEAESIENLWRDLSLELKQLSDKSEIKFIENSGHCIHEDNPEEVIKAIKDLI
ncbi:alpha/beta fold hydrolase [Clostridium sp. UBA6640]|uniref:alpha/beta fold hydrolase n=1 Tax=Clostridium sp. UBA6640 TaxID=1946370 RepID=UPI0025C20B1C|nr:alpha/beta hydrolase [Clostridium sp. UBA6640]